MKKILLFSFILLGHWSFGQTVAFQIVTPAASGAVSDANSTVLESAGTATINVILTRSTTTPDITVDVTVANTGNAVLGTDINFTTQTLTFPAGSTNNTQSFQVAIINNTSPQPTRYAVFQLTNAIGATINSSANSNTHILYIKDDDQTATAPSKAIEFQYTSSYQVGTAGSASAEIVAHDPGTQRLFVVNSIQNRLEILNFSNPASITAISSIDMSTYGAGVNSVAVKNGIVAVAVEGTTVATATTSVPGKVVFLDTNGALISQVNVGVQPDMVGFSPDGKTVMTADEGEPNANYSFDPQGSISIIDLSNGAIGLQQSSVSVLNFNAFDAQIASLRSQGIRIYGPNATVSQDFEPEYVTFSNDSRKAWVVLQENNAMVAVDVVNKQITSIFPLGLKDHSIAGNAFDASDRVSNNQIIPVNWPVKGMYQPDGIAYFEIAGTPYVIGATEGDSRNWTGGSGLPGPGYTEEVRVADAGYVLNPSTFPNAAILKRNSALGRLQVTNANRNSSNQFDEIQVLGGRSFAIWNANNGSLIFDSGNAIEKIVSEDATWGALFNADHSNNNIKDRSDNKGPEPEGVVTTVIAGKTYAFIGLERIGGVMVFDITNPTAPIFSDYLNSRTVPPTALGGDRGAEGIVYIAAQDSPNGNALVLAGNEVSSTVSVYSLKNVAVTAAPVATAATQISAAGFTANWSSVTGATSYIVEYSTNGFTTFASQNSNTTSVAITGLTSNTAYSYRVRAVNAFGSSQPSNVVNAATVLTAPVASAATLLSTNSFTANWATVAGAANYLLDVSSDNFTTFVTGFNAFSVTGTSTSVTGLLPGVSYSYRLRASNANGISANSNVIAATTLSRVLAINGTLQFGDVIVGEPSVQKSIAINNTGNSSLSITGITAPAGYTVTPTNGTVAAGGSLNVQVTFAPTAPQDYNGNLTVSSNATSGTSTLAITGRGVRITAADDVIVDQLTLYPNPGKGVYWIKSKQTIEPKQTHLIDDLGREFGDVNLRLIDKSTLQLDISNLPNGLYYLKLKLGEQVIVKKVLKIN
ncbi:MAG: choice-of-anchor I family protein [Bacteroidota bacterium]|jgi:hypothetical protein|nr:choice-of-anchor I family protein [Cytophagales bacterium]MCE2957386.1 choice-of-anchor I family protein [Flammeovirgaceae bacterium]MCZ8068736.1 choice-of-anchor I family protein [Cytophagales bacterium]